MRPYYSEYVRHCLLYYVKTQDEGKGGHPIFNSDVDRENWSACYSVLKHYPKENMDIIMEIYRPGDTTADKIYAMAKARGVTQGRYWNLVNLTERKIAKRRGLI